jgi:hypothetical protein
VEDNNLSRPEKSFPILVKNPMTGLLIFYNPKYRLYLTNQGVAETSNAEEQLARVSLIRSV